MLSWFDFNPERYWWVACAVTAAILFLLLRPLLKPNWNDVKCPDWWWSPVIVLLLGVGRWPTWFVTRQFNDDESFMIAGAATLRHDPVFWRSVDGGTAGPLDIYALLPVGWLQGIDTFASARITAFILIAVALIFTHQTLALVSGRQVARVATFSAVYLEAFTLSADWLHYSTELVPMALLALAVWAGASRMVSGAVLPWNIVGGFALGAVPFAKLQAAPAALLLGLGWMAGEIWSQRENPKKRHLRVATLCLASFAPLAIAIVLLIAAGGEPDAIRRYVLSNIHYASSVYPVAPGLTKLESLVGLMAVAARPGNLVSAWAIGSVIWMAAACCLSRSTSIVERLVGLAALSFFLISLISLSISHRPFLHYCQLMVMPVTLLVGSMTGLVTRGSVNRRCAILCTALIFSVGMMVHERAGTTFSYFGTLSSLQKYHYGLVASEIMKYAKPGEALGLWGWMSRYYAETGLRQASRTATSLGEIESGPYQEYYRAHYLADFERSSPPVFVDTVGENNFYFKDRRQAHDQNFPALAKIIQTDYTLVADMDSSRIYVRNDRLALVTSQPNWRQAN